MQSQIFNEFIRDTSKKRFNQGDILRNISIIIQTDFNQITQESILSEITLDYAIVVNQECDLEHDFNNKVNLESHNQDKFLPNILLLPAYLALNFRNGTHRGEDIKGMIWNSDKWKEITQNNNSRFHYIHSKEEFQIPDLIIDFKHYYTINRDLLYKDLNKVYLASICEIYRESISHRYSYYLSRIGLPESK